MAGVAAAIMAAMILSSPRAINMSVYIVRAFVRPIHASILGLLVVVAAAGNGEIVMHAPRHFTPYYFCRGRRSMGKGRFGHAV